MELCLTKILFIHQEPVTKLVAICYFSVKRAVNPVNTYWNSLSSLELFLL